MGPQQEGGKHQRSAGMRKRVVGYGECWKNNAARIGGYEVDSSREFLAGGGGGGGGVGGYGVGAEVRCLCMSPELSQERSRGRDAA